MRGLVCFVVGLGAGVPVSWATDTWRGGFAVIVIAATILGVTAAVFALSNVVFPPKVPWWVVREEHHVR